MEWEFQGDQGAWLGFGLVHKGIDSGYVRVNRYGDVDGTIRTLTRPVLEALEEYRLSVPPDIDLPEGWEMKRQPGGEWRASRISTELGEEYEVAIAVREDHIHIGFDGVLERFYGAAQVIRAMTTPDGRPLACLQRDSHGRDRGGQ